MFESAHLYKYLPKKKKIMREHEAYEGALKIIQMNRIEKEKSLGFLKVNEIKQ